MQCFYAINIGKPKQLLIWQHSALMPRNETGELTLVLSNTQAQIKQQNQ